jgi:pimeloyl-ACP methyl ester carboxylesterase
MSLVSERVGQFFVDDHRLEFTEYGGGDRWVVLLPAQLTSRRSQERLARRIAAAGAHVVALDLLGHGRSDRPVDPTAYSTQASAAHTVALLDHLGVGSAILGGTALGANVALEVALGAPDRVRGLVLDGPVLDNAVESAILVSAPLLLVARFLPGVITGVRWGSRAVPRRLLPTWAALMVDGLDQHPAPMAATLHGFFFGRTAPPASDRSRLDLPVLVIARAADPLHPAADAALIGDEVPGAVLLHANAPWERLLSPARLDRAAVEFVTSCFETPARGRLASG